MNPLCPTCGQAGVPMMFGLPVPEVLRAVEDGRIALGGCITPEERTHWRCAGQHEWRSADESVARAALHAVYDEYGC